MKARSIIAAALMLIAAACTRRELTFPEDRFMVEIRDGWSLTKTLLTDTDIENKISCVTLAAYSRGRLSRSTHFTYASGMSLALDNLESYTVYALVNMGDAREYFPEYESDIGDIAYALGSYDSGSGCVNELGIPMAGSVSFDAGDSAAAKVIPVTRLLAKVTVNLNATWPGAVIGNGIIGNMNGVLRPFGNSAAAGSSDMFPFTNECHVNESGSETATMVFYVPENMQGTISGIASPEEKTHQGNVAVSSRKDFLTYLEVSVEGQKWYSGEMVYRSYLGSNATSNFDIERGCAYVWTITYGEDKLCREEWKYDGSSLEDTRSYSLESPIYIVPGEEVSLGDYVSGQNWGDLSYLGWSMNGNSIGKDLAGTLINTADLSGVSFIADSNSSALDYGNRIITVAPLANPTSLLTKSMTVYTADEYLEWKNCLEGKTYTVRPGGTSRADIDYGVTYGDDELRKDVTLSLKGRFGKRWNCDESPGSGIALTCEGDTGEQYEKMAISADKTTVPGTYSLKARLLHGGNEATATLEVEDTRRLAWEDRSSACSSSVGYYYKLSDSEIIVSLKSGYTTYGGSSFTHSNSPFRFSAWDINGNDSFEGVVLKPSNLLSYLDLSYSDSSMLETYSLSKVSASSNTISIVPHVKKDLVDGTEYTLSISSRHGSAAHSILAHIACGMPEITLLVLDPGQTVLSCGASLQIRPIYWRIVFNGDGSLNASFPQELPASHVSWEGATNGLFSASAPGVYTVSATFGGFTARSTINVISSDALISGNWDSSESITLE